MSLRDLPFTDEMHMRASLNLIDPLDDNHNDDDDDANTKTPEYRLWPLTGTTSRVDPRKRTPSVAFREGEKATISKVLDEIEGMAEEKYKSGFNELNFTVGVLNTLFLVYFFAAYPQHFWILYLVEVAILIPGKFRNMVRAKPLNQALYYLDLCWMMNFLGMITFAALVIDSNATNFNIPQEVRMNIFAAAFGMYCGPLFAATAVLPFAALIFHDLNSVTNLVIHMLPPLLMYTLKWHANDIVEAWFTVFDLSYLDDMSFTMVARNATIVYFAWFIPYVLWMFFIGMYLPRAKPKRNDASSSPHYDTVFHSWMRSGACEIMGDKLWKRPKEVSRVQMEQNDFEMRDFFVYMTIHAVASLLAVFVVAYPCFVSKVAFGVCTVVVTVASVYRGANRYTYYTTKMYSRLIRKQFDVSAVTIAADDSRIL